MCKRLAIGLINDSDMTYYRAQIVRWVCEKKRPFSIVKDGPFLTLMKTGRPEYYVPSPMTVSRDVRLVFARTRQRIARMLQEYHGRLNFTLDAWSSPNHRAYVAFCVHLEQEGIPLAMPLDVVEVAKVGPFTSRSSCPDRYCVVAHRHHSRRHV